MKKFNLRLDDNGFLIMETDFIPTNDDCKFIETVLNKVPDGKIWETHYSAYKVNHRDKTLQIIGANLKDPEAEVKIARDNIVFRKIGWNMVRTDELHLYC